MLRLHLGVPFRQASAEERQELMEQFKQFYAKWKASGVKLIGSYHGCGEGVGGYAHYVLFDVDDIETVYQMNRDIFGLRGLYQRHSIDVGLPPAVEEVWESA
jgi:hypothetical protein